MYTYMLLQYVPMLLYYLFYMLLLCLYKQICMSVISPMLPPALESPGAMLVRVHARTPALKATSKTTAARSKQRTKEGHTCQHFKSSFSQCLARMELGRVLAAGVPTLVDSHVGHMPQPMRPWAMHNSYNIAAADQHGIAPTHPSQQVHKSLLLVPSSHRGIACKPIHWQGCCL